MLCRVEMPTHEQIYARFFRYRLLHSSNKSRFNNTALLAILCPLLALLLLILIGDILLSLAVLLLFSILFSFVLFLRPLLLFRAKPNAAMNTEITVFTATGCTRKVTSEEGGISETANLPYHNFVKVVETKHDFYFFYNTTHAYLIDKQYFTAGDADTLRTLLSGTLGPIFISHHTKVS